MKLRSTTFIKEYEGKLKDQIVLIAPLKDVKPQARGGPEALERRTSWKSAR